jgi:hypothetical protein
LRRRPHDLSISSHRDPRKGQRVDAGEMLRVHKMAVKTLRRARHGAHQHRAGDEQQKRNDTALNGLMVCVVFRQDDLQNRGK